MLAGSSPLHQGWHMPGYWLLILAKGNEVAAPELIKEGGRPAGGNWQAERLQLPSVQHIAHVPVQGEGGLVGGGGAGTLPEQSQLFGGQFTHPPPACTCQRMGLLSPQSARPRYFLEEADPGPLLEAPDM